MAPELISDESEDEQKSVPTRPSRSRRRAHDTGRRGSSEVQARDRAPVQSGGGKGPLLAVTVIALAVAGGAVFWALQESWACGHRRSASRR